MNVKRQNFDKKQIEIITLNQYKQILNFVNNIFYSANLLHYKIQNGFEKLEIEIHNIERITHDYLQHDYLQHDYLQKELDEKELDEKEKELKIREVQLKQMTSVKKIGNEVVTSAVQGIASLCKKVKNTINNPQQPQNSNVLNTEHSSNSYYSQIDYNNANNYGYQQSYYSPYNTGYNLKTISESDNFITDSTYDNKRKLSNLQKLKAGIKGAFSEKENYIFLTFNILGAAGVLAYFVPEGLRKFVPSEKLNTVDITVAIGAAALIIIGLTALAYSVYTNIVHSNMIDPTASSHNQNLSTKNNN